MVIHDGNKEFYAIYLECYLKRDYRFWIIHPHIVLELIRPYRNADDLLVEDENTNLF